MSEDRVDTPSADAADWPLRPWILATITGFAGLMIFLVTDGKDDDPIRMAMAAFFFFGGIGAALSLERDRWKEVAIFAVVAGLVMAGLAWRAVSAGEYYTDEQYGFGAGVIALLLALPLFQAGFHRTRFATPYKDTHFFVWTDAVAGAGSFAFVGLTWLMLFLLSELFHLLKIDLLRDLIDEGWFGWMISGAAFGAAMGVLREHLKVLGTLQSVVLLVLSLLAVPLAAAMALFLIAVLVSGLDVLWEATRSATPLLLACAAGSFVLVNAVIRDEDEASARSQIMRWAGLVLALGILPLTLLAAISMGTRVSQYGLSPERLWALVAIGVACAYGLAYLVAVARGRLAAWREKIRGANLNLAVGSSVFALFLALPILDFGGISASNQIGRLERGKITVEEFDFTALRWDFGEAGTKALARMAEGSDTEIAKLAKEAQEQDSRPWRWGTVESRTDRLANLHTEVTDPALREALDRLIRNEPWRCEQPCFVLDLGLWPDGTPHLAMVQNQSIEHLRLSENGNLGVTYDSGRTASAALEVPSAGAKASSKVEVRPFEGRQVYVDGKPVGQPFE